MPKQIPLTQSKFAIVDDEDYEWLSQWRWHFAAGGYAVRSASRTPWQLGQYYIWMHRLILNVPDDMETDHINGNPLDNRRCNLRVATSAQNKQNRRTCGKTSQYKGVHWYARTGKWQAVGGPRGSKIHLGYYQNEIDAARAYDKRVRELYGEFAHPNFPEEGQP